MAMPPAAKLRCYLDSQLPLLLVGLRCWGVPKSPAQGMTLGSSSASGPRTGTPTAVAVQAGYQPSQPCRQQDGNSSSNSSNSRGKGCSGAATWQQVPSNTHTHTEQKARKHTRPKHTHTPPAVRLCLTAVGLRRKQTPKWRPVALQGVHPSMHAMPAHTKQQSGPLGVCAGSQQTALPGEG